ncbi:branched-chain amino acid ABC transporter permease [Clostridium algoriphilum]|uniref:branched-chain amino acid ABC transporter permease n=1 Tax=Clostridium algoriphilum TaxID=198347 RepID=UPI001CF5AEE8|nr:branched-chain amino acid ABC transporter permease [Clostridium algoriphilum]MCB2294411.1 branched-chain amino acid ABC transporter permease [Clostridium algoriphilum]
MKKELRNTIILLICGIILFFILTFLMDTEVLNRYYSRILVLICINVILAVSLNLIIGITGQLTLGHAGFMSIGAYAAAMLTIQLNVPFPIALLFGGLLAGLIGFLIGLPTLSLKGDYLAITTLGFGEIIRVVITNIDQLGGGRGLSGIPPKTNFAWVFFTMMFTILIIYNIARSSQGRAMMSVREDEIAAEAMGINTTKYKIMAFVIGSFFAGIAGGLFSHYLMYIKPEQFNFLKSVDFVTYVVMGGMGSLTGSILSTGILTILPEGLRFLNDYRMIIYPLALIIIMRFRPQGLMGTKELSMSMFDKFSKGSDKDAAIKGK